MCHGIYNSLFAGNVSQLTLEGLGKSRPDDIEPKHIEPSPLRVTIAAVVGLVSLYFITVGALGFFDPNKASLIFPTHSVDFVNPVNCSLSIGAGLLIATILTLGLHATQDDMVIRAKSYTLEKGSSDWFCGQQSGRTS